MTTEKFASVWDALSDSAEEAENMKQRSALMMALDRRIREAGWTQAVAAEKLGVTQPRISDLMRGKIDLFSLDTLVKMATSAGLRVEMRVVDAA